MKAFVARLATCTAMLAGLWWAGGRLPAPPAGVRVHAWLAWWQTTGPLDAVFSLGRLLLLVAAGVWLAALVMVAAATSSRAGRRMVGGLGATPAAPLLRLLLGVGATGVLLTACAVPSSHGGRTYSAPAESTYSPPARSTSPPSASSTSPPPASASRPATSPAPPPPPTLTNTAPTRASDAKPGEATPPPHAPIVSPAANGATPVRRRPVTNPARRWTVRAGDDLWTIAERVVGPEAPTETVSRYWTALIEVNRTRLPDPDDPSLIFPGDELQLPPVP